MSIFSKALKFVKSKFKLSIGSVIGFALGGPVGGVVGSLLGGSSGHSGGGGGGILGEIMRYGKMIQDMVESPIKGALSQIKAGAWQGEDADAFVNEMERDLLPKVAELVASIFGVSTNITRAVTNIVDADKKALSSVSQAVDVFKF
jgi:hypothetical protein